MCMNYCNGVKLGLCDYVSPLSGLGGAVEEQGCGLEIMRVCFILHACSFSFTESTHTHTRAHPTTQTPIRRRTHFRHVHNPLTVRWTASWKMIQIGERMGRKEEKEGRKKQKASVHQLSRPLAFEMESSHSAIKSENAAISLALASQ